MPESANVRKTTTHDAADPTIDSKSTSHFAPLRGAGERQRHPVQVVHGGAANDVLRQPEPSFAPGHLDAGLEKAWDGYFRRILGEFPRLSAAKTSMDADLAGALARLVDSQATVLEAGAGRGDLLGALRNGKRRLSGIDRLDVAVELARQNHPGIDFERADVFDGPAAGEKFDAVVCDRLCHAVSDVRRLLVSLKARVKADGRIFLTAFNALWELPARMAETAGMKVPAPTANWLGHQDFQNLFDLAGLELVRYEDRMICPLPLGKVGRFVNRFVGKFPGFERLSLYRIYVLRPKVDTVPRAVPSVSVVVPSRNESGNVKAAISRTPLMGAFTELIFVEGGSKDGTWEKIQSEIRDYDGPLRLSAFQQPGTGKGDAVRKGFKHARGDILMILDADLTVPPETLPEFYEAARTRRFDYVQGTRLVYPMERGAMRFFNKLGNWGSRSFFLTCFINPSATPCVGRRFCGARTIVGLKQTARYSAILIPSVILI